MGRDPQGLRGVTQRADLEPLIAQGLVTREVAFPSPPPRPKTDRQVRLLADAEAIAGRCRRWGARRSRRMCWRGWRGQRRACGRSRQPSRMSVRLRAAAGAGESAGGARLGDHRTIVVKGPATVSLLLAGDAITDALVALRGAEKHRAVLQALQGQGGTAWIGWVYAETGATLDTLRDLEAAGLITVAEEMVWRDPLAGYEFALDHPLELTEDQERAWGEINQRIKRALSASKRLLTDDGKVALRQAQGVDRVSPSRRHRLRQDGDLFAGDCRGAGPRTAGSRAGAGDRADAADDPPVRRTLSRQGHGVAQRAGRGRALRRVASGADGSSGRAGGGRLPLGALPAFPRLGLIVLDEEHEPSYKQERTPRYHARTVAMELGRITAAPVILGSATPALETYFAAKRGEISCCRLPQRIRIGRKDVIRTSALPFP